jgi:hypothetical protein
MKNRDMAQLATQVHEANRKWWTNLETGDYPIERNTNELLMLVVSELAEAMEGHRKNLVDDKLPHRKMIEVELADALIRLLDIAGRYKYSFDTYYGFNVWSGNAASNLFTLVRYVSNPLFRLEQAVVTSAVAVVNYAEYAGYDVWGAVDEKMIFNVTRADHSIEHRLTVHGKKY